MADPSGFPLAQETAAWNQFLKTYVREDGGVDYVGVAKNRPALETFVASYAKVDLTGTHDNVRKALYINLYNAGMMLNLLRYTVESSIPIESRAFLDLQINQIKIPGGNIWNGNYTFALSGQKVTLDDIEHGLIRGNAKGALKPLKVSHLDPRIHAAVNCAALSCPPLRTQAYTPESVDAMLEENMQRFLSNSNQFSKVRETQMKANAIVFWYYEDFDAQGGAGHYLAPFILDGTPDKAWKVRFLGENFNDRSKIVLNFSKSFDFAYDWRVNDVRNRR